MIYFPTCCLTVPAESGGGGAGLAGLQLAGPHYEDYCELVDNITSCNVVDNYLMLDEYEQNLSKGPAISDPTTTMAWYN